MAIFDILKGYKTYIGIVAAAVYEISILAGWVSSDPYVWTAIATWTGVSARAAIN